MLVHSIMSKTVDCVSPDDRLEKLRDIFSEEKYHHLLVEEDGRLVGVISDRDVNRHLSPFLETDHEQEKDRALLDLPAKVIMAAEPITVKFDSLIDSAAIMLLENNISCLPVVGDQMDIRGIMTWKDILQYYVYVESGDATADEMDADTIFNESYERCRKDPQFLSRFYELFVTSSSSVKKKFEHTNLEKQANMLLVSLELMLQAKENPEGLGSVAKTHDIHNHNIKPSFYTLWLDCLIEAVQATDSQFSADVEASWRAALQPGIDFMKKQYQLGTSEN